MEKQAHSVNGVTRSEDMMENGTEKILKRAEVMRLAFGKKIETLSQKARDLEGILVVPGVK